MKLLKWWKARRLRIAQERYAYWKAKHESLKAAAKADAQADDKKSEMQKFFESDFISIDRKEKQTRQLAEAAANEAKLMERVEAFMRDS